MTYPTDPAVPGGSVPGGSAPGRPGRALGIVSVIILGVCVVLPAIALSIMMATIDPLIGWYLVILIPISVAVSALTLTLSLVGLVTAARQQAPYGWPLTGLLLSGAILLYGVSLFFG